jgi:hypothetical protein
MIVNLGQLTQEQIWGIQYARQLANAPIAAENARIEYQNAQENTEIPLIDFLTDQVFIDNIVKKTCDSYFTQLIAYKEQMALDLFRALTPQRQEEILAELQIPDVIE